MNTFRYFMPVDTYFGRDCIAEHKDVMKKLGQKALIVTGRTSAKKNGSQQDVTDALEALGMQWVLFDEIPMWKRLYVRLSWQKKKRLILSSVLVVALLWMLPKPSRC